MKTFWRLLKLAGPVKGSMVLAALTGCITVACGVGLMATSAYLISMAALHPSFAALSIAIVGVRFFGIARGAFRYLERLVSHQATFRLLTSIRVWLYEALEPLMPARVLDFAHSKGTGLRSGDILSRIVADVDMLQNVYVRVLAPPLVALLVALGMWWLLGAFNQLFALVFTAFYLLAAVGIPSLAYVLGHKAGEQLVERKAELSAQMVDSIQGIADIVAFGQESRLSTSMRQLDEALARLQMRMAHISGLQSLLSNLFLNLAVWTMLLVAIPLVQQGQLHGVYLALLILATASGFEAVQSLPEAFQQLGGTLRAAKRLFEIVDARPEVCDEPGTSPQPACYDIELRHVGFSYVPGRGRAVKDVSFTVPQGQCLALVGLSGAGKSTLAQLLQRFWEYQEGHIRLGGYELRRYRQDDLHKLISVVTQDTHLFNTTVRENLRLAKPAASFEELVQAAKQARIHEVIEALPHGYDTQIGEQGLLLSGGERQRLAIARAILKDAPILLLDEPTANLDALTEREVLQELRTLMKGRTTLMITHRLVDMDIADEIVVLNEGKVVECGKPYELMQLEGYYWKLWNMQRQVLV
ncbi:thiol reductant ABC exporter subunit CydC [Ktedonosporobacter rubrisoli]|uniref:Thiol reductant ABC exporter subunit CydC n=1 Tax=Ktedonosporobacter rubrisoli TaxID=2509675 RepID=A0A4P6JTZ6_KTERU|nr:thiol reductant ABC exporter subunit CydC [Ktedonosporobacter rubrisoli]QBD78762.1 thiol reductant ABC exporter subunit CydC [Ktedonosporobacter rubrisoli]